MSRHVAQDLDRADQIAVAEHGHDDAADKKTLAVFAQMPAIVIRSTVACGLTNLALWHAILAVLWRAETMQGLAQHVLSGPAEDPMRALAPVGNATASVCGDHCIVDGTVQGKAVAGLSLKKLLLEPTDFTAHGIEFGRRGSGGQLEYLDEGACKGEEYAACSKSEGPMPCRLTEVN